MDGLAFIAAVVALFVAFGMRRRLTALQTQLANLTDELRSLRTQAAFGTATASRQPAPERQAQTAPEPADASAGPERAEGRRRNPASIRSSLPAPTAVAAPATTLEERLGTRWAVWVGGLALALGGVLLVRYSIEQGVFGPGVRVALGALFCAALWWRPANGSGDPSAARPSAPFRRPTSRAS